MALVAVAALAVAPAAAVAASGWSAVQPLSASSPGIGDPQVAVDPAGNAIAVWRSGAAGTSGVQTSFKPAGGTWGPAETVWTGTSTETPDVEIDAGGRATVVWTGTASGGKSVVHARTRAVDGTWGATADLSNPAYDSAQAEVAVAPLGAVSAIWRTRDGGFINTIYTRMRPADGGWGAATRLSATGVGANEPKITVDIVETATAVWSRFYGVATIIEARRLTSGTWGPVTNLSDTSGQAGQPQLDSDPAGNATVVWVDGPAGAAIRSRSTTSSGWSAAETLSTGAGPHQGATVAVDPAGNATAAWSSGGLVRSATRPAGGTWSTPAAVTASGSASSLSIALSADGAATLVWADATSRAVLAATRPSGGTWSTPATLSAADATLPDAAVDPQGDAVAIWQRASGANLQIEMSVRDGSRPDLDAISVPASGAPGQALAFSASAGDRWSPPVAVTWAFGDGLTANGTNVGHAYGSAGTFTVTVTARDAAGNTSVATRTVTIAAPPPAQQQEPAPQEQAPVIPVIPPLPSVAPRITSAKLSAATIRAGRSTARNRGRRPSTTLTLTTTTSGTLSISTFRRVRGYRKGDDCQKKRIRKAKRCTLKTVRYLQRVPVFAGVDTVRISARFGKRRLTPGRYVLTLKLKNSRGDVSPARRIKLRVVG